MALNLEDKKALVAEVAEVAAKAQSVVAAEYRGLTVGQMTELRSKARKSGVYMRVVKNTLARKALAGTSFESVGPMLKGPLVLAFSKDDPGAAARVVKDFAKANEKLEGDSRVSGRPGIPWRRTREGREPADPRTGAVDAARCHEGTDPEVRRHACGAGIEAGAHHRRRTRPETGRERLTVLAN